MPSLLEDDEQVPGFGSALGDLYNYVTGALDRTKGGPSLVDPIWPTSNPTGTERFVDYRGWDSGAPSPAPQLPPDAVSSAIQPAPNTEYGNVLPIARDTNTGDLRLAMPSSLRSFLQGGYDLSQGPRTGTVTPEATMTLLGLAAPELGAEGDEGTLLSFGGSQRAARAAASEAKARDTGLLDQVLGQTEGQQGGGLLGDAPMLRGILEDKVTPDAPGFDERISTRLPSKTDDVHLTNGYQVGKQAYDNATGPYQGRTLEAIQRHPGVPDDTDAEGFVQHLAGNIRGLYDAVPEDWRDRATFWYDGANQIAQRMGDQFGTSARAQAANLASLSPNRDWYQNVEMSHRVANIVANHADDGWTPGLDAAWTGTPDSPGFASTNAGWAPIYGNIQGKTLSEIQDPTEAALWVRLHDRAYAPHSNFQVVTPEGDFQGWKLTNQGRPANLQWQSLDNIGNAISALRDDSMDNISQSLSSAHKVRSFYNNIISPNAGSDVTVDTHAIAAGLLRPLGSDNPEVSYGLGSPVKKEGFRAVKDDQGNWQPVADPWPTTMDNAGQGLKGTYPLYAEAYRRVADDLGLLPRQVQSATWEGIRGLYPDVDRRNPALAQSTSDMWRQVEDGTNSADFVRTELLKRGIRDPAWHKNPNPTTSTWSVSGP